MSVLEERLDGFGVDARGGGSEISESRGQSNSEFSNGLSSDLG